MNDSLNSFINQALFILNSMQFLRAYWFYAFIPLLLYLLLCFKSKLNSRNWNTVVDPQLMPFVLSKSNGRQRRYPLLLTFIAASLCITALAGPVYKKLPQPVYREQSSLVVLLDLSQSMNASDIKPSRLSRAKLELLDLLETRKTGQTALIVYAADAFVVTPLTDDNSTIANLVPSLETDMMPAQGSNLASALAKTVSLFSQSGVVRGDILVITDDIKAGDENAIKKVTSQGHRLSVFGIGTTSGAPVPLTDSADGGFLQDKNGAIVIPKLSPEKLQRLALTGNGLYSSLRADDSDTRKLTRLFQSSAIKQDKSQDDKASDLNADLWQEEGHWLLLPVLLFAALWARKGWLAGLLPFALLLVLQTPQQAYAEDAASEAPARATGNTAGGIDIKHLWSSPDQKAMKAFNAGDTENAARQFTSKEWKASAYYRSGDYQAAADALKETQSSNGFYNKGNALARLGQYKEAMAAYEKAIELDANNGDAKYNLQQVKDAVEKQQQEQQQNQDQGQDQEQQSNEEQSEQQQDGEQGEDDTEQQQDESSDQQSPEEKSEQQPDQQSEQQQSEENQQPSADAEQQKQLEQDELKQRDAEAEKAQQQEEEQQYQQDQHDQQDQKQAEQNEEIENREGEEKPAEIEVNPVEASITEEEKATEQWLKRIPDDPGGLLRRKFYYQYKQVPNQNDDNEPW